MAGIVEGLTKVENLKKTVLSSLQARNRREVGTFGAIFEAHSALRTKYDVLNDASKKMESQVLELTQVFGSKASGKPRPQEAQRPSLGRRKLA